MLKRFGMEDKMNQKEIKRYTALNELAETDGIVILGGSDDQNIPLGELKQAFALDTMIYNRSLSDLTIGESQEAYDACVAAIRPEMVLLHLGEADREAFQKNAAGFDQAYRELIGHIRKQNRSCRIVIVSLKSAEKQADTEMNRHLKYIAESEQCEYEDISGKRIWNPKETKDVVSFLYATGFVRPLKKQRPIYDLVKILFCFESNYA